MANTGVILAGSGINVNDGGNAAWSNPGNIIADDGNNASANVSTVGNTSQLLVSGTHDFSVIPDNATIVGIIVTVQRSRQNTTNVVTDHTVRLTKDGSTLAGDNKADGGTWPTSPANISYGDVDDLWGTTWTAAEIKAATFGIGFKSQVSSGTSGTNAHLVDVIWINVFYSFFDARTVTLTALAQKQDLINATFDAQSALRGLIDTSLDVAGFKSDVLSTTTLEALAQRPLLDIASFDAASAFRGYVYLDLTVVGRSARTVNSLFDAIAGPTTTRVISSLFDAFSVPIVPASLEDPTHTSDPWEEARWQ